MQECVKNLQVLLDLDPDLRKTGLCIELHVTMRQGRGLL